MRIAVLGGEGNMGRWLVNHFLKQKHSIIVSDPNETSRSHESEIEYTDNNISAVDKADVVFVSVPMESTPKVIEEIIPHMKINSALCEISTLKTKVHETLRKVTRRDIRLLSIHPLFGPNVGALERRFALVPVEHLVMELELLEFLFGESNVVFADAEEHDRIMALTLSLPYFTNIVLASIINQEDIDLIDQLSGTTFSVQFMLTGSIMSHSSSFLRSLFTENTFTVSILEDFLSKMMTSLSLMIQDVDSFEEAYQRIQSKFGQSINLKEKYNEMYQILETRQEMSREEVKQ